MKYAKVFRVVSLAVVLSLLLVAIPAAPALALDYNIELDPEEGEIGERFYVRGDDWPKSDYTEPPDIEAVDIYFSSQEADEGDEIGTSSGDDVNIYEDLGSDEIDEDGEFSKRVTVPDELTDGRTDEDVHGGTYYIYVTMEGDDEIEAVAQFTLIAGEISLDTTDGVVGTAVEITGNYFADREDITIDYDTESLDIESGDSRTDSGGGFESTILVPESTAGSHTIAVEDESGHSAEATFTVEPEMTISSNTGEAGDTVDVTGTGFGGGVYVDIMLDATVAVTDITDEYGSFSTSFEVPDVEAGSYDIKVEDDEGNESESEEFTIYIATSFSISPVTTQASPGHVGTNITVSGVGFEPNFQITITYATEPIEIATAVSDAEGAFSATFKAPQSVAGAHIITATDGTNSLTTTFYMESTPPLIPEPLQPEMGVTAETPVRFDWADVTDDSPPVTYTLQVATDEDFTADCMVLNKPDLTDSDYTLTEDEKLEPTKKEEPYYWRVKAIDGASNESDWSAPGSFYIAGGLALPFNRIHLWWALGAVAAVFFGYWMGKRRAAYSY